MISAGADRFSSGNRLEPTSLQDGIRTSGLTAKFIRGRMSQTMRIYLVLLIPLLLLWKIYNKNTYFITILSATFYVKYETVLEVSNYFCNSVCVRCMTCPIACFMSTQEAQSPLVCLKRCWFLNQMTIFTYEIIFKQSIDCVTCHCRYESARSQRSS